MGEKRPARIPFIDTREQLPPEQRGHYERIAGSRGDIIGPFDALLNSPALADRVGRLGAYIRFESSLSETERELTIVTTARVGLSLRVGGPRTVGSKRGSERRGHRRRRHLSTGRECDRGGGRHNPLRARVTTRSRGLREHLPCGRRPVRQPGNYRADRDDRVLQHASVCTQRLRGESGEKELELP